MASEVLEVNVASQNILLDYRRTNDGLILPQDKRIESITASFEDVEREIGRMALVGIQEAHLDNGEIIAEKLGYDGGYWFNHNQKPAGSTKKKGRKHEYMGVFGDLVDDAVEVDIGDERKAVLVIIAGTAFLTIHLRSGGEARSLRLEQIERAEEAVEQYPNAVIMGDFNEPPPIPRLPIQYSKARQSLEDSGFISVFKSMPNPTTQPRTSPIEPYFTAAINGRSKWEELFIRHAWSKDPTPGWPIDDIYVRGQIAVHAAGIIPPVVARNKVILMSDEERVKYAGAPREPSDHLGVWAQLALPTAA